MYYDFHKILNHSGQVNQTWPILMIITEDMVEEIMAGMSNQYRYILFQYIAIEIKNAAHVHVHCLVLSIVTVTLKHAILTVCKNHMFQIQDVLNKFMYLQGKEILFRKCRHD